jgi:ubiquinone/menaquinone biosynthesis C-methylase UbiE
MDRGMRRAVSRRRLELVSDGAAQHAGREYWDRYFASHRQAGSDLDWEGTWTNAFLPLLREARVNRLLELGCGTGNDAARLAGEGIEVVALDFSVEAIAQARHKFGELGIEFVLGDMAQPLAFPEGAFDAVMANVALHMFSDQTTRTLFAEIARVVRSGGLFLFHVNAVEDRRLRERRRPVVRELEPNYVLEQTGQTVRFFSADYLHDLLSGWAEVALHPLEIRDRQTDQPFKRVWRGIARNR